MKKAFDQYTHLAGSHGGAGSLWQGPDHLLVIDGRGWPIPYAEVYRRVDYARIQALTMVPTATANWASMGFGLGAVLFGLLTYLARDAEPYLPITLAMPGVLLSLLFVVNLIRGRSCRCSLQTAVQVLRLRPLNRMKKAEPVVRALEALCRQHQGAMPAMAGAATPLVVPSAPLPSLSGTKPPWTGSNWTLVAGLVVLAWGGVLAAELFVPGVPFTIFNGVLGTAAIVMAIVAIVQALRMRVPGLLLTALWGSLVTQILAGAALYAFAVAAMVKADLAGRSPQSLRGHLDNDRVLSSLANFNFEQTGQWGWWMVGVGVALAVWGIVIVLHGGRKHAPRSASPARPAGVPPPPPPMPRAGPPAFASATPPAPPALAEGAGAPGLEPETRQDSAST